MHVREHLRELGHGLTSPVPPLTCVVVCNSCRAYEVQAWRVYVQNRSLRRILVFGKQTAIDVVGPLVTAESARESPGVLCAQNRVKVVLQWCYSGVTVMLQRCYRSVIIVFSLCFHFVTVVSDLCHRGAHVAENPHFLCTQKVN
jgi:hypothetical protein